jgi:hypothetical protein
VSALEAGVTELAREAVQSAARGDLAAAASNLQQARITSRRRARRERQVVELVSAIVDGDRARAAGLAAEHRSEFPGDAHLLDELLRQSSATGRGW